MSVALIKRITANFNLRVPNWDMIGWGREMERNLDILDAVIFAATGIGSVRGVWLNLTGYIIGDRVVDAQDGRIYQCLVGHTSAAAPTTFAQDRVAHPTFWQLLNADVHNRGQWTTATVYNENEFVYDQNRIGITLRDFTSGVSYDADVANGDIETVIDLSFYANIPNDGYVYGAENSSTWKRLATAAPGGDWNFETAVGGTPSVGSIRYNNATPASVTALLIHKTDGSAIVQTTLVNMIAQAGVDLFLGSEKLETKWVVYTVTGPIVDSGAFLTVPVVFKQTGAALTDSEYCRLSPLGGAGSKVVTDDTAPAGPLDGQLWYRTSNGKLYVFYDDGTSSQWVESSGAADATTGINLASYSTQITASSVQTFAPGSTVKITDFNVAEHDPSGFWNATTDVWQPTKAGLYLISGKVMMSMEASKILAMYIYKNTVALQTLGQQASNSVGGNFVTAGGSVLVLMNGSTDFLDARLFHSNVASPVIQPQSSFTATYLGEAGLPTPVVEPVKRGHLWGCVVSNDAGDLVNDLAVSAGECASAQSPYTNMVTTTKMTKRLDAAWTAGDGNGGLDQGSIANTSYHMHRIRNPATGVIDHILSLSHDEILPMTVTIATPAVVTCTDHGLIAGAPIKFVTDGILPTGITPNTQYYVQSTGLTVNAFRISTSNGGADVNTTGSQSGNHQMVPGPLLPAGYTQFRRISSHRRVGGNLIIYKQTDDTFKQAASVDRNSTAAFAAALLSLNIPQGIKVPCLITNTTQVATSSNTVISVGSGDDATVSNTIMSVNAIASESTVDIGAPPPHLTVSNRQAQIFYSVTINSGTIVSNALTSYGYVDTRGRLR